MDTIVFRLQMLQNDIDYINSFGFFNRWFWSRDQYLRGIDMLKITLNSLEIAIYSSPPTQVSISAAFFLGVFREKYWPHK